MSKIKIIDVEQRTPEWDEARLGRVTGTGLKRVLGTPKVREGYFYEILAERLSTEATNEESAMDRGVRLEKEAIEVYEAYQMVKIVSVGFVQRKDNNWLGYSPDGLVEAKNGPYTKDIEIKCLSSANHIKTFLTQQIPEEYSAQALMGFVVNDDLVARDFVFYDPRISIKPFFIITLQRKDFEKEIVEAKLLTKEFINSVNEAIEKVI